MTDPELDYAIGHQDGFHAGWNAANTHAASLDQRDEQLARRIVALLLQHDYNQELVRTVIALHPYPGRTPSGMNWRERLGA